MRTLKFIVKGQMVEHDPSCDFTGLVPGTEGYLQAEFSFSSEWSGCKKVVGFYSNLGKEYEPRVLYDGKTCIIPAEALTKRVFKIQVFGKRGKFSICTNKVKVDQNGGKKTI